MKISLQPIRARRNFYITSDNPNVSLGTVDRSFFTSRIALKDKYHKKPIDMIAYTPVELNYLDTLARIFFISAN